MRLVSRGEHSYIYANFVCLIAMFVDLLFCFSSAPFIVLTFFLLSSVLLISLPQVVWEKIFDVVVDVIVCLLILSN
jgi:hypothetical protein